MPLIEEITMNELADGLRKSSTVILPCGSVEEHGPHLPLGTDTWHAMEIARRTAQKRFVWVAPPLWYGLCRSTSQHPGTIGISGLTLRTIICDIVRSLYKQGFRNVIILSGHAGSTHSAMLIDACEELVNELDKLKCAVLTVLDLGARAWKGIVETTDDSHAGEVETSVILHMRPETVKGTAQKEWPDFPPFMIVRDKRKYWPGGVWGDPQKASPEKGKKLLEASVAEMIKIIDAMEKETDD
ncbi:MAG TPA: creatininase family protein [Thermodesulforhabdus norvegica]|uniref:Creatininase family protein n=1 Tax=Thermodesulforhabdus norvegica TaxID=39841 RepID=A0A7C1AVP9_9BACT|nr:creatininase family protein [Thermodesulforhabdus norvegica]